MTDKMTKAWQRYEAGRAYNDQLVPSQYDLVNTNIEFFAGNQWIHLPHSGAMQKLPDYYDSHRINGMVEGPFRINIPGVRFTNNNWPYILRCGQIWSMTTMVIYPILTGALYALFPAHWQRIEMYVLLVLPLGGLFIPMVVVGKKYE